MEIIRLADNGGVAVQKAVQVLSSGGVILYPTDTLYGLGADAFSDAAVDTIYAIKGRDPQKPIHAVFADMQMVEKYAEVTDTARKLAEKFLPGALTLVLNKKSGSVGGIARGMDSIGVRIPDNSFCIETARAFGRPFTATSANLSGAATGLSIDEILSQLEEKNALLQLAVDVGTLPQRLPSTVLQVVGDEVHMLREGAVPKSEIDAVIF